MSKAEPKAPPRGLNKNAVMAGVSVVIVVVVGLLAARQPGASASRPSPTAVQRQASDPPAARDTTGHYAPGSAAAVAEQFLRLWFRAHYDQAAELATDEIEARCRRNLQQLATLSPDQREELRQVQLISEAAEFDLERAVVTEVDAGAVATREVVGILYAHGPSPDGRRVASRRGQTLVMVLRDGGWKVSRWSPAAGEPRIQVGEAPR
ncbi:MAG: hypothetical protein JNK72_23630 [Myxococcales bacterium]|nr:hypothetical protein [Myxococcales bacterium]